MENKPTKKQQSIDMLMSKPDAIREDYKGIILITHSPCSVAVYEGKGWRPAAYYRFKEEERRIEFIAERKGRADRQEQESKQLAVKYEEQAKSIKEGTILYSSWGYEQTNIDFYKVVKKINKKLWIVPISQRRSFEESDMSGSCIADPETVTGEPFVKFINKWGGVTLNSFSWCGPWDGQPKGWTSYA